MTTKSIGRQAADLLDKVTRINEGTDDAVKAATEKHMAKVREMEADLPNVENKARLVQLAKMAGLVAKADKDVQAAYFRLVGEKAE